MVQGRKRPFGDNLPASLPRFPFTGGKALSIDVGLWYPSLLMESGVYALLIRMARPAYIQVGALGSFSVPPGWYVYTGSATRNLMKRVDRHLAPKQKLRWHIDYLTATKAAMPVGALLVPDGEVSQCELNQKIGHLMGSRSPILKFGASDCRAGCPAHLWYTPKRMTLDILARVHPDGEIYKLHQ